MKSVTKIEKPKKNSSVGGKIKYVRCNVCMSQVELANKLGRKREEITMYETGARVPDIYTLKQIATIFNVSTDYLLGLNDFESADISNIVINKVTGLSQEAITNLININKYHSSSIMTIINYLLEQEKYCPEEYYNLESNKKISREEEQQLKLAWKKWEDKKYIRLFTYINNYYNFEVINTEDIKIKCKSTESEKEINKRYTITNEIISNNDLVNYTLLRQIETLLQSSKEQYLNQNNRNEE